MKKYFAGFLAGAIFALSSTVFADEISSLIGKEVDGTAEVSLNGETIGSAVIIDGTSYAPVRVISEATGLDVAYNDGVVQLESNDAVTTSTTETTSDTSAVTSASNMSADELKSEISQYNSLIDITKSDIERVNTLISSGKYTGDQLEYLQNKVTEGEKLIKSYETTVTELQAQLTELQAQ